MNTNNFDVFSHAFFNEYEIGSYDNDLPSDSSSTSSESEIAYRIKPQGKVKICSRLRLEVPTWNSSTRNIF